jgi:hypothetical protein
MEMLDYEDLPAFADGILAMLETSQNPLAIALGGGALGVMSIISPEVLAKFLRWLHERRSAVCGDTEEA